MHLVEEKAPFCILYDFVLLKCILLLGPPSFVLSPFQAISTNKQSRYFLSNPSYVEICDFHHGLSQDHPSDFHVSIAKERR